MIISETYLYFQKHIYIFRNIFIFSETYLYFQKHIYIFRNIFIFSETYLYFQKLIYIFRNIFIRNDRLKIGDFGISRILMSSVDMAQTFVGTPFYMSPEVLKHEGYNSKSDVW